MRKSMMMIPLLLGAGCASGDLAAICAATTADRARAARIVAEEGTDAVVLAVQPLIAKTDAACGK